MLFDPSLPTIMSADASDYGLRGVLTRLHADDVEYIVFFASLWLKENTPQWKKEALASKETAFFLVGTSLYATNRSQSINHFAGYKRNWTCWNESGEVVSPAAGFFL